MKSATFKTLCQAVGLDQETIAAALDESVPVVSDWWQGQDPMPGAVEYLQGVVDVYDQYLESEMEAVDDQPEGTVAVLTVYRNRESYERTFAGHAPMPWRVYEAAIQQLALYVVMGGKSVEVEYVHAEV